MKIRLNHTEQIVHVDRLRLYTRQGLDEDVAPPNSLVLFRDTDSFRAASTSGASSSVQLTDDFVNSPMDMQLDNEPSEMVTEMSREIIDATSSILWDRRRPLEKVDEDEIMTEALSESEAEVSVAMTSLRQKPMTRELILGLIRFHLDNREEKSISEADLLDELRIVGPDRMDAYRILRCLCLTRRPKHVPICTLRYHAPEKAYIGLEASLCDRILAEVPVERRAMRSNVHSLFIRHIEPLLNVKM